MVPSDAGTAVGAGVVRTTAMDMATGGIGPGDGIAGDGAAGDSMMKGPAWGVAGPASRV